MKFILTTAQGLHKCLSKTREFAGLLYIIWIIERGMWALLNATDVHHERARHLPVGPASSTQRRFGVHCCGLHSGQNPGRAGGNNHDVRRGLSDGISHPRGAPPASKLAALRGVRARGTGYELRTPRVVLDYPSRDFLLGERLV